MIFSLSISTVYKLTIQINPQQIQMGKGKKGKTTVNRTPKATKKEPKGEKRTARQQSLSASSSMSATPSSRSRSSTKSQITQNHMDLIDLLVNQVLPKSQKKSMKMKIGTEYQICITDLQNERHYEYIRPGLIVYEDKDSLPKAKRRMRKNARNRQRDMSEDREKILKKQRLQELTEEQVQSILDIIDFSHELVDDSQNVEIIQMVLEQLSEHIYMDQYPTAKTEVGTQLLKDGIILLAIIEILASYSSDKIKFRMEMFDILSDYNIETHYKIFWDKLIEHSNIFKNRVVQESSDQQDTYQQREEDPTSLQYGGDILTPNWRPAKKSKRNSNPFFNEIFKTKEEDIDIKPQPFSQPVEMKTRLLQEQQLGSCYSYEIAHNSSQNNSDAKLVKVRKSARIQQNKYREMNLVTKEFIKEINHKRKQPQKHVAILNKEDKIKHMEADQIKDLYKKKETQALKQSKKKLDIMDYIQEEDPQKIHVDNYVENQQRKFNPLTDQDDVISQLIKMRKSLPNKQPPSISAQDSLPKDSNDQIGINSNNGLEQYSPRPYQTPPSFSPPSEQSLTNTVTQTSQSSFTIDNTDYQQRPFSSSFSDSDIIDSSQLLKFKIERQEKERDAEYIRQKQREEYKIRSRQRQEEKAAQDEEQSRYRIMERARIEALERKIRQSHPRETENVSEKVSYIRVTKENTYEPVEITDLSDPLKNKDLSESEQSRPINEFLKRQSERSKGSQRKSQIQAQSKLSKGLERQSQRQQQNQSQSQSRRQSQQSQNSQQHHHQRISQKPNLFRASQNSQQNSQMQRRFQNLMSNEKPHMSQSISRQSISQTSSVSQNTKNSTLQQGQPIDRKSAARSSRRSAVDQLPQPQKPKAQETNKPDKQQRLLQRQQRVSEIKDRLTEYRESRIKFLKEKEKQMQSQRSQKMDLDLQISVQESSQNEQKHQRDVPLKHPEQQYFSIFSKSNPKEKQQEPQDSIFSFRKKSTVPLKERMSSSQQSAVLPPLKVPIHTTKSQQINSGSQDAPKQKIEVNAQSSGVKSSSNSPARISENRQSKYRLVNQRVQKSSLQVVYQNKNEQHQDIIIQRRSEVRKTQRSNSNRNSQRQKSIKSQTQNEVQPNNVRLSPKITPSKPNPSSQQNSFPSKRSSNQIKDPKPNPSSGYESPIEKLSLSSNKSSKDPIPESQYVIRYKPQQQFDLFLLKSKLNQTQTNDKNQDSDDSSSRYINFLEKPDYSEGSRRPQEDDLDFSASYVQENPSTFVAYKVDIRQDNTKQQPKQISNNQPQPDFEQILLTYQQLKEERQRSIRASNQQKRRSAMYYNPLQNSQRSLNCYSGSSLQNDTRIYRAQNNLDMLDSEFVKQESESLMVPVNKNDVKIKDSRFEDVNDVRQKLKIQRNRDRRLDQLHNEIKRKLPQDTQRILEKSKKQYPVELIPIRLLSPDLNNNGYSALVELDNLSAFHFGCKFVRVDLNENVRAPTEEIWNSDELTSMLLAGTEKVGFTAPTKTLIDFINREAMDWVSEEQRREIEREENVSSLDVEYDNSRLRDPDSDF